jgi:hypothetical protein
MGTEKTELRRWRHTGLEHANDHISSGLARHNCVSSAASDGRSATDDNRRGNQRYIPVDVHAKIAAPHTHIPPTEFSAMDYITPAAHTNKHTNRQPSA